MFGKADIVGVFLYFLPKGPLYPGGIGQKVLYRPVFPYKLRCRFRPYAGTPRYVVDSVTLQSQEVDYLQGGIYVITGTHLTRAAQFRTLPP